MCKSRKCFRENLYLTSQITPIQFRLSYFEQILTVIKEIGTSEMGTTERDVLVTLQRKGIQAAELQVRRVIADLQDNGLLYGTIDEQHFKATED